MMISDLPHVTCQIELALPGCDRNRCLCSYTALHPWKTATSIQYHQHADCPIKSQASFSAGGVPTWPVIMLHPQSSTLQVHFNTGSIYAVPSSLNPCLLCRRGPTNRACGFCCTRRRPGTGTHEWGSLDRPQRLPWLPCSPSIRPGTVVWHHHTSQQDVEVHLHGCCYLGKGNPLPDVKCPRP